jgi:hypothetical protein
MVVQTRFFSCRFSIPHAKQRPTTAPRRTARVRATAFPARPWSDAILMLPRVIEGRSVDPNWCARSDDKSGQSRPPKAIKGKSASRDNRQDQTRHPKPQGWNIPGIRPEPAAAIVRRHGGQTRRAPGRGRMRARP